MESPKKRINKIEIDSKIENRQTTSVTGILGEGGYCGAEVLNFLEKITHGHRQQCGDWGCGGGGSGGRGYRGDIWWWQRKKILQRGKMKSSILDKLVKCWISGWTYDIKELISVLNGKRKASSYSLHHLQNGIILCNKSPVTETAEWQKIRMTTAPHPPTASPSLPSEQLGVIRQAEAVRGSHAGRGS